MGSIATLATTPLRDADSALEQRIDSKRPHRRLLKHCPRYRRSPRLGTKRGSATFDDASMAVVTAQPIYINHVSLSFEARLPQYRLADNTPTEDLHCGLLDSKILKNRMPNIRFIQPSGFAAAVLYRQEKMAILCILNPLI